MRWRKIYREESGGIHWSVAEELRECESASVVFWNGKEDVAEIIDNACFIHIVDTNTAYTHYMILTNPKTTLSHENN